MCVYVCIWVCVCSRVLACSSVKIRDYIFCFLLLLLFLMPKFNTEVTSLQLFLLTRCDGGPLSSDIALHISDPSLDQIFP